MSSSMVDVAVLPVPQRVSAGGRGRGDRGH